MKKAQDEPESVWGLVARRAKLLDSQVGSGGTGDNNRRRHDNADALNPANHEFLTYIQKHIVQQVHHLLLASPRRSFDTQGEQRLLTYP